MPKNFLPTETIRRVEAYYEGAETLYPQSLDEREELLQKQVKNLGPNHTETKYYHEETGIGVILTHKDGRIIRSVSISPSSHSGGTSVEFLEPHCSHTVSRRGPTVGWSHTFKSKKNDLPTAASRYTRKYPDRVPLLRKKYYANGNLLSKESARVDIWGTNSVNGPTVKYYKNGKVAERTHYRFKASKKLAYSVVDGINTKYTKDGNPKHRTSVQKGRRRGWEIVYNNGHLEHAIYHSYHDEINHISSFAYRQDTLCHKDKLFVEGLINAGAVDETLMDALRERGVSTTLAIKVYEDLKAKGVCG